MVRLASTSPKMGLGEWRVESGDYMGRGLVAARQLRLGPGESLGWGRALDGSREDPTPTPAEDQCDNECPGGSPPLEAWEE